MRQTIINNQFIISIAKNFLKNSIKGFITDPNTIKQGLQPQRIFVLKTRITTNFLNQISFLFKQKLLNKRINNY